MSGSVSDVCYTRNGENSLLLSMPGKETHNTTRKTQTNSRSPASSGHLAASRAATVWLHSQALSSRATATAETLARLLERAVSCGEQASEFELVPRGIVLCSNLPHF